MQNEIKPYHYIQTTQNPIKSPRYDHPLCLHCKYWQRNSDISGIRYGKCIRQYPTSSKHCPETTAWDTCGEGK